MVQCVNGHLVCTECRNEQQLIDCPTCRYEFSDTKPLRLICQVIEALPPLCKHKNCGRYLKADDDHEKYCEFNPTSCRLYDCNWTGTHQALPQHVQDEHPTEVMTSDNDSLSQTILLDHFNPYVGNSLLKPLIIKSNFFWINVVNDTDKKMLVMSFQSVPIGKPKGDIYAKISCVNEVKFMMKLKLTIDPERSVDEVNFVPIPQFMLTSLMKNNNISFDISIKVKQTL